VRSTRHSTRSMSIFGSQTEEKTLKETVDALASFGPGAPDASGSNPVQPRRPSPSDSKFPPILNIPPAEDPLLRYLTSIIQTHGHRVKAARITSRTLLHIHAFTRAPPLRIIREAVAAAAPAVKCLAHRRGTKTVYKPIALGEKQRVRFALQWILKASDSKAGQTLEERLAREFIAVIQGKSTAITRKEEVHQFAMVNRCVVSFIPLHFAHTFSG
jgi:small subunit ribosomal protein S7